MKNKVLMGLAVIAIVTFLPGCRKVSQAHINPPNPTNTAAHYVSTSGSDSNNGLSATAPFKTLAKAASMVTGAGDSILLKRGDQWVGEGISLAGKQGTASNPIVISAYGTGADPVIISNTKPAISITNSQGFIIEHLKMEDNQYGIDLVYPFRNGREYIRIRYCTFVGGGTCIRFSGDYQKDVQTAWDHNVRDVLIENCVSTTSASFVYIEVFANIVQVDFLTYAIKDFKISNCQVTSSTGPAISTRWVEGGYIDGCTILSCGTEPATNGSCSVLLRRCKDFDVKNTEVGYTNRTLPGGPDGEAIDFEGHVVECEINNCNLHHNAGPAMMIFYTMDPQGKPIKYNKRNYIINNTFYHNNQSALHPEDCEIWITDPLVDPAGPTLITGNFYTRVPGVSFILVRPNCTPNMSVSNNTELVDGDPYEWKFDNSTSGIPAEGSHNDIVSITRFPTIIRLSIDASLNPGEPAFALDDTNHAGLNTGLNIDASANKKAYIKIRNNTPARQLRVYWANTLDETYSDAKSKTIAIILNTSDYSNYTIDLGSVGTWTGNIDKIKLVWSDMTSGTGMTYIDNLKVAP